MRSNLTDLFKIKHPIIQAGMIWCSGWELASAVSNSGALGLIGSGSMYPEVLREHIQKCKNSTSKPFGVNVPLLYPEIDKQIKVILEEGVKIVFTSAGNPKTWTKILKDNGVKVVHVVSNLKFALKAEEAGVDAIVAEGFEAGGHNGKEETTTLCLIPMIRRATNLPLIAAGGISTGHAMLSVMALGADGVQVGSRFVACTESSAHEKFKNRVINCRDGDTLVVLKKLSPVRLIKNAFFEKIHNAEQNGASSEMLEEILGRARAKKGMFEGDLEEGELEIGQVASTIKDIKPAKQIVEDLIREFDEAKKTISALEI